MGVCVVVEVPAYYFFCGRYFPWYMCSFISPPPSQNYMHVGGWGVSWGVAIFLYIQKRHQPCDGSCHATDLWYGGQITETRREANERRQLVCFAHQDKLINPTEKDDIIVFFVCIGIKNWWRQWSCAGERPWTEIAAERVQDKKVGWGVKIRGALYDGVRPKMPPPLSFSGMWQKQILLCINSASAWVGSHMTILMAIFI